MSQTLLEKLLEYYNISYEDYLYITRPLRVYSFLEGHRFDDIDNAVALVREVINNKGKIIIYGDYDADGVMGTSILVKMFQYLNVNVDYYIPIRYVDGYGINVEHAEEYVKKGYELVITVDNGISAFEPIKYLKDNGVKVLVLDHHQVLDEVPVADVICHPTYSHFGEIPSSGAFTAFVFSIALLERIDEYLSILASISLISDMMPLLQYNRDLLRYVIDHYRVGRYLSIDLLADNEPLDANVIGAKVAPRINSIGRLTEDRKINDIVKYFVYDDEEYILNYSSYIIEMNESRKQITREDAEKLIINEDEKAIVIYGNYKEGLLGLFANSLLNKYHVPVVVFTDAKDGILKGSGRVPEGYSIIDLFNDCVDLLTTFGGHAQAGGCSLDKNNFEQFKKRFIESVEKYNVSYNPKTPINLTFIEITSENYDLIQSFAPFGESWDDPYFKIRHIKTSELSFIKEDKHISKMIGNSFKLIGFNFPKKEVQEYPFINVYGTLRKTCFRGKYTIEFLIDKIEPCN